MDDCLPPNTIDKAANVYKTPGGVVVTEPCGNGNPIRNSGVCKQGGTAPDSTPGVLRRPVFGPGLLERDGRLLTFVARVDADVHDHLSGRGTTDHRISPRERSKNERPCPTSKKGVSRSVTQDTQGRSARGLRRSVWKRRGGMSTAPARVRETSAHPRSRVPRKIEGRL